MPLNKTLNKIPWIWDINFFQVNFEIVQITIKSLKYNEPHNKMPTIHRNNL